MLKHMKATDQVPWGVQLGNERGNSIGGSLSGASTAAYFIALDDAIKRVWPESEKDSRPVIMGPDGSPGGSTDNARYLQDFFGALKQAKRSEMLTAFTYHSYGVDHQSATNSGIGPLGIRNATLLSQTYGPAAYYSGGNLSGSSLFG